MLCNDSVATMAFDHSFALLCCRRMDMSFAVEIEIRVQVGVMHA